MTARRYFFGELDDTHRPHKLYRHQLGTDAADLVFHEPDGRFFLSCYRSSSERQLILQLGSKTTSEAWVLDAATPHASFSCVAPREEAHEYDVDHGTLNGEWRWLIRSNQHGINFALFSAHQATPSREHWQLRARPRPAGDARRHQPQSTGIGAQSARERPADYRSTAARSSSLSCAAARRRLQPVCAGQPGVRQPRDSPAL